MTSSIVQYRMVTAQPERFTAQFDKLPAVKAAIADFQKKAPSVTTVDGLLKDRRTLQFVLSAFQLEEQVDSKGILKKLLTEDPANSNSLANKLNDPRYKAFAKAMEPLRLGSKPFSSTAFVATVVKGYQTNEFEKYEGEQTPGLREALYFKRNISGITSSLQILGSKALTEVVRVGLGLPKEMGLLSASKQAKLIDKNLDVTKFSDPAYVDRFLNRYLANTDKANSDSGGGNPMLGLFGGSGSSGAGGLVSILA